MNAYNIHTQKIEALPDILQVEKGFVPHPKREDYERAGYRFGPECAEKYWKVVDDEVLEMSQAEKDAVDAAEAQAQADAAAAAQAAHEAWLQTVEVYERVIEAPSVIVHSVSAAKGVGIAATDDGELVPYIAHESPYNHAEAEARKLAAIEKRNTDKANGKAGIKGQLQQRIENIERYLGWRQ
jgi:nucleoid-associated protein YgaU